MKLKVRNIGGCKEAEIDLPKGELTVLAGPNGAGKTSVLRALQVLVSRDTNPLRLNGPSSPMYARNGDVSDAEATLLGDGWSLKWVPGSPVEEGGAKPPRARLFVFDPRLLDDRGKAAASEWSKAVKSKVPRETLKERLDQACAGMEQADNIAGSFYDRVYTEGDGWDGALAVAEDRARQHKREWAEAVALCGEKATWGVKKGANWRPKGWDADCEGTSKTGAQAKVKELGRRLEDALRADSGSAGDQALIDGTEAELALVQDDIRKLSAQVEHDRTQLKELQAIAQKDQWRREAYMDSQRIVDAAKKRMDDLAAKANAAQEAADAENEQPVDGARAVCPRCNADLVIKDGSELHVVMTEKREAAYNLKQAWSEAKSKYEQAQAAHDEKRKPAELPDHVRWNPTREPPSESEYPSFGQLKDLQAQAQRLQGQLNGLRKRPASASGENPENAPKLADELDHWEKTLHRIQSVETARGCHDLICVWDRIAKVLHPTGLRAEVAQKQVERFNRFLAGLSKACKWNDEIKLEASNWRMSLNGRDYHFLSASERWRVAAAVSMTIAIQDGSPVAALDNADTLVGELNAGDTYAGMVGMLEKACEKSGLAVVIGKAQMGSGSGRKRLPGYMQHGVYVRTDKGETS